MSRSMVAWLEACVMKARLSESAFALLGFALGLAVTTLGVMRGGYGNELMLDS
jgi:hypothetical protein